MRKSFINTLIKLAERDKRIFLLTGDLGFSVLEKFKDKFPERFFDMGVAEQNMIGVAAGLALSGKIVFVYSIVPFLTMRCFEQIRNDLCYQNLNVKLVGVGEGLSYGSAGSTHHSICDIAIMRALPNMKVFAPGDPFETDQIIKIANSSKGPAYIRLGKSLEPEIYSQPLQFNISEGIVLRNGYDITIFTTGNMLYSSKIITDILSQKNIDVRLVSMPTIKPIDKNIILRAAKETEAIFTIEEHSLIGGLGSVLAEVLAESKNKTLFKRISLPDEFCKEVGSQEYLREKEGLSINKIVNYILKELKNEDRKTN
jgi:transketolase